MSITRNEVEKVSLLSRLLLKDHELDVMTEQMGKILGYMDLLGEVETINVDPMAHALDISDAFRPDEAKPSLSQEEALANAPNRDDECYRVPAVLGDH
mgnify:CR=1 FL=1